MELSRRRPPLFRTGAMTAGLFLAAALAGVALLGAIGPSGTDRRSPRGMLSAELLWEEPAASGAVGRLSPGGLVFLWEESRLRVVEPGGRLLVSRDLGASGICLPLAGREATDAFLVLRTVPARPGGHLCGETVRLDSAATSWQYPLPGGILLAAAATPDGRRLALGSLHLDREDPEGRLHLLDAQGGVLARFNPGAGAIFRLALSADGDRLAAVDPRALHYVDYPGGGLWSRPLRGEVRDLGLLSHGGPAALTATALHVYDAQGRLLWRRLLDAPGVALAVAPGILAVATRDGVTGYSEDGRRVWHWSPPVAPRSLSLSPDGTLLLVVGEDGRAGLYRLAGIEPSPGEERAGEGR